MPFNRKCLNSFKWHGFFLGQSKLNFTILLLRWDIFLPRTSFPWVHTLECVCLWGPIIVAACGCMNSSRTMAEAAGQTGSVMTNLLLHIFHQFVLCVHECEPQFIFSIFSVYFIPCELQWLCAVLSSCQKSRWPIKLNSQNASCVHKINSYIPLRRKRFRIFCSDLVSQV